MSDRFRIETMGPTANGVPITAGPAAVRSALLSCIEALADGLGRDWEREEIERRARAWEQRHVPR